MLSEAYGRWTRETGIFVVIMLFALLLLAWNKDFSVDYFIYVGIFAILAISLNLEAGYSGLMNFGVVAFFAVGAYSAMLFSLGFPIFGADSDQSLKLHFIVSLFIAIIAAAIVGYIVSLSTLGLRADYLAIVTIAFGEILRMIILHEDWLRPPGRELDMGGFKGLRLDNPLRSGFTVFGWTIRFAENFREAYLILVWIFVILSLVFAQTLVNSPYGRIMRSIREDEIATEGLGKDTAKYKSQIFTIGSGIAGLAGGLYGYYLTFISPDTFLPLFTFTIWIMMIIGGKGNNFSVVLGAALITFLERSARLLKEETLDFFWWTIRFEDYFPKLDVLYKFGVDQDEMEDRFISIIIPADLLTLFIVGGLYTLGCFAVLRILKEREERPRIMTASLFALGSLSWVAVFAALMFQIQMRLELIFTNLTKIITPLNTSLILLSILMLGIIYVGGIERIKRMGAIGETTLNIIFLMPIILFTLILLANMESSIELDFFSSHQLSIYNGLLLSIGPLIYLTATYIGLEQFSPSLLNKIRSALLVLCGLAAVWLPITLALMLPIEPSNFRLILTGILLIVFVLFRPQGIIPEKAISIPYEEEGDVT